MYLFERTGDHRYARVVEESFPTLIPAGGPSQWSATEQNTLLDYAALPHATSGVAQRIRSAYQHALVSSPMLMPAVKAALDPYRSPISEYTWGSKQSKAAMGWLLTLADAYDFPHSASQPALAAAGEYLHYLHGVNPLGLVYLTNMASAGAEHSARSLYHGWFGDGTDWDEVSDTTPGPAIWSVGRTRSMPWTTAAPRDAVWGTRWVACEPDVSPPLGQPPMKA